MGEVVSLLQFRVGAAGAAFYIFQIFDGELAFLAARASEELAPYDVGDEVFEMNVVAR